MTVTSDGPVGKVELQHPAAHVLNCALGPRDDWAKRLFSLEPEVGPFTVRRVGHKALDADRAAEGAPGTAGGCGEN